MSERSHTIVSDVMTTSIISIDATATVHDATVLMREHKKSSVLVNRRDDSDEFGLVVVSDIASRVLAQNLSPKRVNVYEIMSKPVLTVPVEMNIVYAIRMLANFKLSRALVIDHDRNPLGIVTLRDMVLRNIKDIEDE
ncbi:MAG: CBS domain-containing protein [Rhodospirillaceae bacterium]|jgi:signal-transduction protein with cAMP-binding, CBS, and nucleotidyltransferase domain|nr:CBS domain-containing protein [Rhodospirillaceae bacterium]MBT7269041.1 CBS domain-containing protein [Rhodospirillaceae bacterium]